MEAHHLLALGLPGLVVAAEVARANRRPNMVVVVVVQGY
jgi:hypothetical protein